MTNNDSKELHDTVGYEKKTKLEEMVSLGKEYREDIEIEVFGEEVKVQCRALPDKEFLPIISDLAEAIDLDVASAEEATEEAMEEVDDVRTEEGDIDITQLNDEFVETTQRAAIRGITAAYNEDGERHELPADHVDELVNDMIGGISVEIGMRVLDVSGSVRDAELFR